MKTATVVEDGFVVDGEFHWALRGRPLGRSDGTFVLTCERVGPVVIRESSCGLGDEHIVFFVVDGHVRFGHGYHASPWLCVRDLVERGKIDCPVDEWERGLDAGQAFDETFYDVVEEAHYRGFDRPPEFWLRWMGIAEPTSWMLRGFFVPLAEFWREVREIP